MKKAFLSMTLFILICFTANAQNYQIKKQVVGTGGFVGQQVGENKMYGIFGQPITGILKPTVDGQTGTMYLGFWSFSTDTTSIEEIIAVKGVTNYPNPVSTYTNFKFNLKEDSYVTLNVYNSIGMLVATVTDNNLLPAGQNSVEWNNIKNHHNEMLNSGSYVYELLVAPAQARSANTHSFRNILMIAR